MSKNHTPKFNCAKYHKFAKLNDLEHMWLIDLIAQVSVSSDTTSLCLSEAVTIFKHKK